MTFYFSANCRDIKKDKALYERVIDAAAHCGWSVNNNWLEAAEHRNYTCEDWNNIAFEASGGIKRADALIAEASGRSAFGVGYEVAVALQSQIPVLLLCEVDSLSYASGLHHALIYYREYDEDSLGMHIGRFLEAVVTSKKVRI